MGWYWLFNDLWFSFSICGQSDFADYYNQAFADYLARYNGAYGFARQIDENRKNGNYDVVINVYGGRDWDVLPICRRNYGKMSALETLDSIVSELKGKYEKEL